MKSFYLLKMPDFKRIYDTALSFLFTKRCRYCRNVCNITDDVCECCADDISKIEGNICYKCGCSKLICSCKGKSHFYESVCAPYYYEGAPEKAVINLKHKKINNIIDGLSEDMAQCVKDRYENLDFDICTFVPMHFEDEKKRGYNQASLLAEGISKRLCIPFQKLVNKDYKTPSQHALPEAMRSGNLSGALSFNEGCNIDVSGMRILLCDDIKTTGATLDECAKILLFKGAAEVRCIAACVTKPKVKKDDNDDF